MDLDVSTLRQLTAPLLRAQEINQSEQAGHLESGVQGCDIGTGTQEQDAISLTELKSDPTVQRGEGFCISLSLHDGATLYVTNSITPILGYPKDMLVGQCILNYLYPRDRLTFASHLTQGLHTRFSLGYKPEQKIVFYVRVRKYGSLSAGRRSVYIPFQLTCFTRDIVIPKSVCNESNGRESPMLVGTSSQSRKRKCLTAPSEGNNTQEPMDQNGGADETHRDANESNNTVDPDTNQQTTNDDWEAGEDDRSATSQKLVCYVASARQVKSAYNDDNESHPVMSPFNTRHTSSCHFSHLDSEAISYLGYLPQDVIGYSVFDFYHADDLILLRDIYELVMREQGSAFRSKPYRFKAFNGDYVTLETEWSCFIDPWSKKVESVVGRHRVLNGPLSANVFDTREDEVHIQNSMGDGSPAFGMGPGSCSDSVPSVECIKLQDSIKNMLSQPVKKPHGTNDSSSAWRKRRLAAFVSNIIDTIEGGAAAGAFKEYSCSDLGSVVMGEISPHQPSDSEPSTETPPSFQNIRLQDNIERFFVSQPRTNCAPSSSESSSQNQSPDGSNSQDGSSSNPQNGSSLADSGLGASGDGNMASSGKGTNFNSNGSNENGNGKSTSRGDSHGDGNGSSSQADRSNSGSKGGNSDEVAASSGGIASSSRKKSAPAINSAKQNSICPALTEDILMQHNKAALKLLRSSKQNAASAAAGSKLNTQGDQSGGTGGGTKLNKGQSTGLNLGQGNKKGEQKKRGYNESNTSSDEDRKDNAKKKTSSQKRPSNPTLTRDSFINQISHDDRKSSAEQQQQQRSQSTAQQAHNINQPNSNIIVTPHHYVPPNHSFVNPYSQPVPYPSHTPCNFPHLNHEQTAPQSVLSSGCNSCRGTLNAGASHRSPQFPPPIRGQHEHVNHLPPSHFPRPMYMPFVYNSGLPLYPPPYSYTSPYNYPHQQHPYTDYSWRSNDYVPTAPPPPTVHPLVNHHMNHHHASFDDVPTSESSSMSNENTERSHYCVQAGCGFARRTPQGMMPSRNDQSAYQSRKSAQVQTENFERKHTRNKSTGPIEMTPTSMQGSGQNKVPTSSHNTHQSTTACGGSTGSGSGSGDDYESKTSGSGSGGERKSDDSSFCLSSVSAIKSYDNSNQNSSDVLLENDSEERKSSSGGTVLRDPPWMEGLDYTADVMYRYRMATPVMDMMLKKDSERLAGLKQPSMVKKQLALLTRENSDSESSSPSPTHMNRDREQECACSQKDSAKLVPIPGPSHSNMDVLRQKAKSTCSNAVHSSSKYYQSQDRFHLKSAMRRLHKARPTGYDILEDEMDQDSEAIEQAILHEIGADDDNL